MAVKRWLVIVAALAVLAPVGVMMVVAVTPTPNFDVDPRSLVDPATGRALGQTMMGPGAAAWWHAWAVAASAGAIAASLWAGARLQIWACGLAGLGMAAAAWHMTRAEPNGLPGGAWIAGAALGLAAAHVAQLGVGRRWLAAGLAALLVPIALDAVWYVQVAHPQTVAQFEANRDETLQSRGWEADSPQAVLFERRLRSPDAVGALGLSNVLGSVTAALTVLAAGVGLGLARRGRWRDAAGCGALVAAGLAAVWMTQSKGAILTLPVAMGLVALGWAVVRRRRGGRLFAAALLAMPMLAVLGVLVRAALGAPETWEGERSLLFRWYYWQGSARLWAEDGPLAWLVGVGPARFKGLYGAAKPALSPEEVTSAHNVVVDYAAMLGLGGVAWASLLIGWAVLAAWRLPRVRPAEPRIRRWEPPRAVAAGAAALAAVVFGTEYVYTIDAMVIESALVWLAGAIGAVVVMAWLVQAARPRWAALGLVAAAGALLMHNQIEMSFHHWSAVLIGWTVVGAAGGVATRRSADQGRHKSWRYAVPAGLAVAALLLAVLHAAPTQARQERIASAAAALQHGALPLALEELDAAGDAAPTDPLTLRWRVRLRAEAAQVLQQQGRTQQAAAWIAAAEQIVRRTPTERFPEPAMLWRSLAQLAEMRGDVAAAIDAMQQVVALSPQSLSDRLELARVLDEAGRADEALEHYRAALAISDASYLDPAKQLTGAEFDAVRERVGEAPAR